MKKRLIRAGAVLAVALAAGHLVQTINAEKASQTEPAPKSVEKVSAGADPAATASKATPVMPATASLTGGSAAPAATIEAKAETPAPAPAAAPATAVAEAPKAAPAEEPKLASLTDGTTGTTAPTDEVAPAPAPAADSAATAVPTAPAATANACSSDIALAAGPQATISITLTAPCRANERVVLRHAGLAVAERLDDKGMLKLDLPALNDKGQVSVLFADADILRDSVPVPGIATVTRFAVQWMADDAFQLHAMEDGATYGQPGDVSAATPVSPKGGYLMKLGNPTLDMPMMAEVYTFPSDTKVKTDVIVESAVTELTCGRELLGETILSRAGSIVVTDLNLATPECDAVGDILVLKNLLPDLTLAAN